VDALKYGDHATHYAAIDELNDMSTAAFHAMMREVDRTWPCEFRPEHVRCERCRHIVWWCEDQNFHRPFCNCDPGWFAPEIKQGCRGHGDTVDEQAQVVRLDDYR
jgi:hypothetical protein